MLGRTRLGEDEGAGDALALIFLGTLLAVVLVWAVSNRPPTPTVENVEYLSNGSITIVMLNSNNQFVTINKIELAGGEIECTLASPIVLPPGTSKLIGYINPASGIGSLNKTFVSCINTEVGASSGGGPIVAPPPPWG